MLKVAIVDDEPLAVRRLSALLAGFDDVEVVGSAKTAAAALTLIGETQPDLVLLDIRMPGQSGIRLADDLRRLPESPAIVFVTAFSRYAVQAFGVAALDYLVKPVEPERLGEALERVRRQKHIQATPAEPRTSRDEGTSRLVVKTASGAKLIDLASIVWIEAERDYVRVHTGDRSYFFRAKMTRLEDSLRGQGFLRVHRSALISIAAVDAVTTTGSRCVLQVKGGQQIPVSRRLASSVRTLITAAAAKT